MTEGENVRHSLSAERGRRGAALVKKTSWTDPSAHFIDVFLNMALMTSCSPEGQGHQ